MPTTVTTAPAATSRMPASVATGRTSPRLARKAAAVTRPPTKSTAGPVRSTRRMRGHGSARYHATMRGGSEANGARRV